jgi:mitofusin
MLRDIIAGPSRRLAGKTVLMRLLRLREKLNADGNEDQNGGSSGPDSSSSHVLLPLMTSLSMLPSMGPFGLVIAGGIIWSKISWRVIVVVGGCYGGLYAYERLTWNVVAKQRAFKRQLVDYTTPQLCSVVPIISQHCSSTLTAEVQNTYEALKVDVDAALLDGRKDIEKCEEEIKNLNDVVDISASYIAKIHNHEVQFSGFLQRFLKGGH